MSQITIGKSGSRNIHIDIDALLRGRMLVQANSGKGKSWLLRRLAEQFFGHIQTIIIDPEGEFATLREKFGFVLVGKGGETPADLRSASLVAHKLLELRAPAVCDLYEMKPASRHEWVQKFLDAMIDAPKQLWHPCVVMVDEAHTFCPEKGAGESCASEAMVSLATRGRKRGFACIFATQRLGKLRKDAAAELLNVLIGGTFIDIDRKRAADALGVYGTDQREFFDEIKILPRGNFFALGPAISDERILVEVGPVETTHAEAGSTKHSAAPPPAPEKVKALLPKLADLPKTAEEKAKTESELRTEIRSLKAQLRTQPTATREIPVADPKAIAKAVMSATNLYRKQLAEQVAALREIGTISDRVVKICTRLTEVTIPDAPKIDNVKISEPPRQVHLVRPTAHVEIQINHDGLSGPERRILKALGELLSIGKDAPPREMVAAWSSYSAIGGAFGNPLGALKSKGLVTYPQPGIVALTDEGQSIIGSCEPPDQDEIQRRIENTCSGPERKILSALLEHGERSYADDPVVKQKKNYTRGRWQIDAHGFTRSNGDRPLAPEDLDGVPHDVIFKLFRRYTETQVYDFERHVRLAEYLDDKQRLPVTFMLLQPASWSPDVWSDIARMRTLNMLQAQKGRQMHLCPMQFDIARRVIAQFSMPGETVLDPFAGIGTVPMCAVEAGRKAIGIELCKSYYFDACSYAEAAERKLSVPSLFAFCESQDEHPAASSAA